ncbi:hexose kinase [Liquorilactobacillus satsumensis]|uniref:Tagatose-6-phosphate kinase n=1 Tax=Liquorilactobacillus satsumensis DSM 16230 = JCM 12392 TaxID=1423801 RepID=A0A0R1V0C6_9LACO|nr:hexose kinase [Liquorilactobacillus satsumensis]KRL99015.1 tagatose-6-phosphate kinase [Liquorilactobacillus satsumensis DSM 16230 = JCM 12392]MCC7666910.1 tagatose-6-phosphate kinase [Liquorilactobacillus satsumensis]MCP9357192.1 hexose kinase [Liquorilactobacillus satsumensis]MCP9371139.1 hexose kinase [Liquorilactobacillus satsumensis]
MILTVTMNPSIDMAYSIEDLKENTVNRVSEVRKTAGGKGLNVSRVIKMMGRRIVATGALGGNFGAFIEEQLDKEKINHAFIHIKQETRNSIAILHDGGKQTEILEAGPVLTAQDVFRFLENYKELLSEADVVTISGSLPQGIESDFYAKLSSLAKQKKIKVMLDSSGESLKQTLLNKDKPYLIKPNQEEISELLNIKLNGKENSEILIKYMSNKIFQDVAWIVVSLGAAGAIAKHNNSFYRVKIPKIHVENPVGSGDATLAGLAIAISEGKDDEETLKTAMTLGMLNTMEKQTGCVNKKLFSKYFGKISVTKLEVVNF